MFVVNAPFLFVCLLLLLLKREGRRKCRDLDVEFHLCTSCTRVQDFLVADLVVFFFFIFPFSSPDGFFSFSSSVRERFIEIIMKKGGRNEGETHTTSEDLCGSWSLILDWQSHPNLLLLFVGYPFLMAIF